MLKLVTEWNKQIILNKVREMIDNNISIRDIYKVDRTLYYKAVKKFGSWSNMLLEIGEQYTKEKYTASTVLEALIERKINNLPLSYKKLRKDNSTLYNACIKFYGSFESAINSSGLNYLDNIENQSLMAQYGLIFEEIVGRVFKELNIHYKKGYSKSIKPDFVLPDGEWADAKLSDFTVFTCDTIKNYEPHCNKLTIIYLRGDKNREEKIGDKTTIISIYRIIENMVDEIKLNYIDELNNLWRLADDQEIINRETRVEKNKKVISIKKQKKIKQKKVKEKKVTDYRSQKNSSLKGASKNKPYSKRWVSSISVNGKRVRLGVYDSKIEAAKAYDEYIINNNLNRRLNF